MHRPEPTGEDRSAASAAIGEARRPALLEAWSRGLTVWYLSGLLFALGFSLGLALRQGANARAEIFNAFSASDGRWYKQIAADGYSYDPTRRSNIAFFP